MANILLFCLLLIIPQWAISMSLDDVGMEYFQICESTVLCRNYSRLIIGTGKSILRASLVGLGAKRFFSFVPTKEFFPPSMELVAMRLHASTFAEISARGRTSRLEKSNKNGESMPF